MTTTSTDPRSRVLDAAKDAVAARMRAEADLLVAAAQWALLHPVTEAVDAAGWCFGEDLVPLAGAGAPLVAEFSPAELAAVLGWQTETVQDLMGEALELCSPERRPEHCPGGGSRGTSRHRGRRHAPVADHRPERALQQSHGTRGWPRSLARMRGRGLPRTHGAWTHGVRAVWP